MDRALGVVVQGKRVTLKDQEETGMINDLNRV
jgi:hypothetical protein